jgi:hypothetical protein
MIVGWYPMVLGGAVSDALGNTGECRRKAWPSWFMRSGSAAECPRGARWDGLGSLPSVWLLCGPWWPLSLGRNNCECLDDQSVIVRERRGRFD